MNTNSLSPQQLHMRALDATQKFQRAEVELLQILDQMDRQKAFLALGYPSLFKYVVDALKLSEAQAFNFINVSRKSREVPELRREIETGALSISKARKVVPVLTRENSAEWIAKAVSLPQRALEKEVARLHPEAAEPREIIRPVAHDRARFQMGISESDHRNLRRAQALLSQREKKSLNLEETFHALLEFYLSQKDPLRKAERSAEKSSSIPDTIGVTGPTPAPGSELTPIQPSSQSQNSPVARQPAQTPLPDRARQPGRALPARVRHQVFLRDRGRCCFVSPEGKRCGSAVFTQIHHRKDFAKGGAHLLRNLQTLCSAHHSFHHANLNGPMEIRAT